MLSLYIKQIKKSDISAHYVFIAPPSEEVLEQRLRGYGTGKHESIQRHCGLEYSAGVHKIIANDARGCVPRAAGLYLRRQ
jgi:guanylate kinase